LQHDGVPANPLVKRGDRVLLGQCIGEAGIGKSAPVHASVSGTVVSIGLVAHPDGRQITGIEIENDGLDDPVPVLPQPPWRDAAPQELLQRIQSAGVVGMGGRGVPTQLKLSLPSNKPVDTLIINGAESEPYLTSDHRLMLEKTEQVLEGIQILKKILNTKRCFFGIEGNKSDAIKKIAGVLSEAKYKDITICTLIPKYPQGSDKMLIKAIAGREVPSGGSAVDIGCVVLGVATALAVYNAVVRGLPLYERVVTVSGPAVGSPKNLLVRIGTPVSALLSACEIDSGNVRKIVMGGPMQGIALSEVGVPVIKTTTGLLAFDNVASALQDHACINCGHCLTACPIGLVPSRIVNYIQQEDYIRAREWNVMDCIGCGCCGYICPSKINMVHWLKLGRYHVDALRRVNTNPQNAAVRS
jgi:electron transport complex protein RnfC